MEILGGGRCKTKNLSWGEYGYFLELHITISVQSWELRQEREMFSMVNGRH